MNSSTEYIIDFKHIKKESEKRTYHLTDKFFSGIEDSMILSGDVSLEVSIVPQPASTYQVSLSYEGTIKVPCDRCLDPMTLEVEVEESLEVKLGESFNDENNEVIELDAFSPEYDFSWVYYELLALHIPIQHTHEDLSECNPDVLKYIVDVRPKEPNTPEINEVQDSIWGDLRNKFKSE